MNQALLNSMTVAERKLVAETSHDAMTGLDEEELLALHSRIRRARSKYVSVYRRKASGAVVKSGQPVASRRTPRVGQLAPGGRRSVTPADRPLAGLELDHGSMRRRITQRHLAILRSRSNPNSSNRFSGPVWR